MNGFDLLAPVYDKLSKLIFGKEMVQAQFFFLDHVRANDRVLILGGGTGWLLEELLRRQPYCEVWYIESSPAMMERAKHKCGDRSNVHFILGTQLAVPPMIFDVVIMNFFLDMFSEKSLSLLIERIRISTRPQGLWMVTDFENKGKIWQHVIVAIMITFFRLVCKIEATKLPDLGRIFTKHGMREVDSHSFFHGFIKSGLYKI